MTAGRNLHEISCKFLPAVSIVYTALFTRFCGLLATKKGFALMYDAVSNKMFYFGGMSETNDPDKLEVWAKWLIGIAILLTIFAFVAPYVFTRPTNQFSFELSEQGQIGDALGGLMNPFIGLAGVIVTGLAFYMQYKANQIQRDLSKDAIKESQNQLEIQLQKQRHQHNIEQFESHFFEMLRLHKDNVNEMELSLRGNNYKGRYVFKRAMDEVHSIIEATMPIFYIESQVVMPSNVEVFHLQFANAYYCFFWGELPKEGFAHGDQTVIFGIDSHLSNLISQSWNATLGHYYRHLYHMVKYVVESNIIIEYENKMRYLNILRAQLSNYEQIMLFYNWLAGYGENWENDENSDSIKRNQYFTRYRMIHNLWKGEVYQNPYILKALEKLDSKSKVTIGKPLLEEDE